VTADGNGSTGGTDPEDAGAEPDAGYPPPRMPRPAGRGLAIAGLVVAVVAFLAFPPLGVVSAVLGALARRKGDPLGRWVVFAGIIAAVAGAIVGNAVNGDEALALVRAALPLPR
jgi:hypothetical protein